MSKHHVGSVIVIEGFNGKRIPAGIITDRDIALTVGATQKPTELRVDQVMQALPVTVRESEGIYETIIKMSEHGVRRLPVVNEEGALYGIICADDLLSLMGEEINNLAKINGTQIKNEQGIKLPAEKHI